MAFVRETLFDAIKWHRTLRFSFTDITHTQNCFLYAENARSLSLSLHDINSFKIHLNVEAAAARSPLFAESHYEAALM
jgi:hypothetical protein